MANGFCVALVSKHFFCAPGFPICICHTINWNRGNRTCWDFKLLFCWSPVPFKGFPQSYCPVGRRKHSNKKRTKFHESKYRFKKKREARGYTFLSNKMLTKDLFQAGKLTIRPPLLFGLQRQIRETLSTRNKIDPFAGGRKK